MASSDQPVSGRRFPRVELSQTALFSLSPSGEKVYCQLAFVVGLKRFAAVSIKRHRSKETPPTEIPTEEGEKEEEENEGGGKLIQTLKTDVKRFSLYRLCTPTTIITTKIPTIISWCFLPARALIPSSFFLFFFFLALPFFTLSYLCSVVERLISLFPSAHKHAHVGRLPGR